METIRKFDVNKCYKYTKYNPKSESIIESTQYYVAIADNIVRPIVTDDKTFNFEIKQELMNYFVEVSKEEAFAIKDMNSLNDNEVKEVARMQQMIDSYETFICALNIMMISKREINYLAFTDTNLDKEMNKIWRWVKEHKGNK